MAVQTGEWWKKPAPKQWWQTPAKQQKRPKQWYEIVGEKNAYKKRQAALRPPLKSLAEPAPKGGGNNGRVKALTTNDGGGGTYDPYAAEQAAVAAQRAAQEAADNKKRGELRGKAGGYLDQLVTLYNELVGMVQSVGRDGAKRINKNYDGKILEQTDLMNEGMYTSDAANAANNLANSSWKAFDRGKIRKARDTNVETLEEGRKGDLSTIGKMVSEDTARYTADRDNTARTRELLGQTEDIGELTSTVNNLGNTVASTQAAKGKYGTQGEFVNKANALGNYDTSTLEKTMQSIVASTSANPAAKNAAMDDLLNGTPLSDKEKKDLKNKYTQVI